MGTSSTSGTRNTAGTAGWWPSRLTVRRLARDLLAAGKDPKWGRLGDQLVDILFAVHDDADLGLLLRFARSPLACRTPALANLRTWTGREWEADDERWDRLLAAGR